SSPATSHPARAASSPSAPPPTRGPATATTRSPPTSRPGGSTRPTTSQRWSSDVDLTATTIPKSDQINAEDLMVSGPVTVTVESVSKGSAEQPVDIHLVEFPGR